jgi:predicted phosphate transport protein (TIGR00153 family)
MSIFSNKVSMLEAEIEALLDQISRAGLIFTAAIKDYLSGNADKFLQRMNTVMDLESEVDEKRREIRYKLYTQMLIPESRGDVLSLLENIDNVIDAIKEVLIQFEIERPSIPESLHKDFNELAAASNEAVNYTVKSARSYLKDIHLINDYINKTYFYEHEADVLETAIKRKVFSSDEYGDLAQKMHIRDFAEHIAGISDQAEDVCERLSVAAIKRSI